MAYAATTIALKFVKLGIETRLPVTQMKLQKILYFAQGVHLVLNNQQALIKEQFQAWKYGPVIPAIYHEYKLYGSQPILDTDLLAFFGDTMKAPKEKLDESAESTIKFTWESTKDIDALRLSNWTHQPGSPWEKYYIDGTNDIIIPNQEIASYFSQFVKQQ